MRETSLGAPGGLKTSLSLKAASQPRLLLSNQLSPVFALPCSLQTAGMPWVWPQAALQTLRSQPRGSMVSSWRAGGVRAGFSQHNSCVCLPQVLLRWPPGRVLHPCPCQHPTQDLEPPHTAGPSCQCSATLCVAAKPQGDPQVRSCGWISRHLRQHQGPAAPSCLCSLLAGQWAPYLARLDNSGSINAWSTDRSNAWIQVKGALCLEAPLGALQGHAGAEGLMDGQCFPSHICCFPLPSERGALRS